MFLSSRRRAAGEGLERATGILRAASLGGTLDLAAALQPDVQEVFVVTGAEQCATGSTWPARRELARSNRGSGSRICPVCRWPSCRRSSPRLPDHSIVYYVMLYRDGANANFNPLEALDEVVRTANAPVYCWVDSAMDHGIVGGVREGSGAFRPRRSASWRCVSSTASAPSGFPIETPVLHSKQVDWRQLQRWNISESRVPAGTAVRFRTPGAWERYRPYFLTTIAIVLAQTALIAGLLLQRARRHQAEAEVRGQPDGAAAELRSRIRDLAARLLGAQEAERARIARDLHDDISQQMARPRDRSRAAARRRRGADGRRRPPTLLTRARDHRQQRARPVASPASRQTPADGSGFRARRSAARNVAARHRHHLHARRRSVRPCRAT